MELEIASAQLIGGTRELLSSVLDDSVHSPALSGARVLLDRFIFKSEVEPLVVHRDLPLTSRMVDLAKCFAACRSVLAPMLDDRDSIVFTQAEDAVSVELAARAEIRKRLDNLKRCRVLKTGEDPVERYVLGIVLEPLDAAAGEFDTQLDAYNAVEIRKAAHTWMQQTGGQLFVMHDRPMGQDEARLLETYIAPVSFELGGQQVREGTWLIAIRALANWLWDGYKDGKLTGFSVGAEALRTPIDDVAVTS